MSVSELMRELTKMKKVHPEIKDASIWGVHPKHGRPFPIEYVRFDKRHKPSRIVLEN